MIDFPALKPATRRYSMGVYPIAEESGYGGASIRFKGGSIPYGHSLELGFIALTQSQAKLLRDHYRRQQGGYISFPLSAEAWAGHSSITDLVPATTFWRYASSPEESHSAGGYVDVSVSLVSVPAMINGVASVLSKTISIAFAPGAAVAS